MRTILDMCRKAFAGKRLGLAAAILLLMAVTTITHADVPSDDQEAYGCPRTARFPIQAPSSRNFRILPFLRHTMSLSS